jgi:hypothetical protein
MVSLRSTVRPSKFQSDSVAVTRMVCVPSVSVRVPAETVV